MIDVRPLTDADDAASRRLGSLAFGYPERDVGPVRPSRPDDPWSRWGGFDDSRRLIAQVTDLHHEQWWGGRIVPSSGIASVAVETEQRGRGVTRPLLTAALRGARERGAAIATLFCTSTAVYRAVGFEVGGMMRTVSLPTDVLSRSAVPTIRLRPGDGRDWPLMRRVYDEVARRGNGLLTRRGPLFKEPAGQSLPDGIDAVTLAADESGDVLGYVSYNRGSGYDDATVISVHDCLALRPDAARALLASLGSWTTVAPSLRLRLLPWLDAVNAVLPLERVREHKTEIWMLRPVDVVAATAARGWSTAVDGSISFRLVDRDLPWNDGAWRFSLTNGVATLEPVDDPDLTLDVRGWSALWCGVARAAQLRQTGLLSGGDLGLDGLLDQLLGSGGLAGAYNYF